MQALFYLAFELVHVNFQVKFNNLLQGFLMSRKWSVRTSLLGRYCRKYCWSSSFLYKLMSQAEDGPGNLERTGELARTLI